MIVLALQNYHAPRKAAILNTVKESNADVVSRK